MQSFICSWLGQPLTGVLLLAFCDAGDGLDTFPGAPLESGVFLLRSLGLLFQGDELFHSTFPAILVYTPVPPGIIIPPVASW